MQYSVVQYSEAVENSDFRIDAEYWHPQYLKVENLIQDNRNSGESSCLPVINRCIFDHIISFFIYLIIFSIFNII